MNKTLYKIALVIVLSMAASSAYAASASLSGANIDVGGNTFSASNKVFIGVESDAGAGSYDGTTYCATSVHGSGDKEIMGCASDSRMFYKTVAVGATTAIDPGGSALPADLGGWTSM